MELIKLLEKRRTHYNLGKNLVVGEDSIINTIEKLTELTPDAFNMKSSRVVVALGEKQNELWDSIYDVFEGMVPREKIDGFKNAAGTILYFYDNEIVKGLQDKFPLYADNFPKWAMQSSAMLQINVWTELSNMGLGANLQHYNPVIDKKMREIFDLPDSYELIAQMPFGEKLGEVSQKDGEDISLRVKIVK